MFLFLKLLMQFCEKGPPMQKLYVKQTLNTPEIHFSPEENIYIIRGTSAPEDVRALYYPVIEWIKLFIKNLLEGSNQVFLPENLLRFKVDMTYFNSSSAKFLNDIFSELKKLNPVSLPVIVEWYYEEEDYDMKEAGADIALLAEMEFNYIAKPKID
jgi:hypothetical protein